MSSSTTLSLEQISDVSWGLGSLALTLTVGRYLIRWKVIGKFFWDDALHLLAALCLAGQLACYTASIADTDYLDAWVMKLVPLDLGRFDTVEALSAAIHILFYCCIWAVKCAFLLFYRKLFNVSRAFTIAWWAVLAYNVVTFWVAMAGAFVQCGPNVQWMTDFRFCYTHTAEIWEHKALYWTYAAVVTSDLAVMILPLCMLRGLHMRRKQQWAIGALFSLSLVCVVFDTLRFVKSVLGVNELNILWYNLEAIVAVVVSAMPSYYSLFTWRERKSYYAGSSDTYRHSASHSASDRHASKNIHASAGQPFSPLDSDEGSTLRSPPIVHTEKEVV